MITPEHPFITRYDIYAYNVRHADYNIFPVDRVICGLQGAYVQYGLLSYPPGTCQSYNVVITHLWWLQ